MGISNGESQRKIYEVPRESINLGRGSEEVKKSKPCLLEKNRLKDGLR